MTLDPLVAAPILIQFHTFAALSAFALGIFQFAAPKGTAPLRQGEFVGRKTRRDESHRGPGLPNGREAPRRHSTGRDRRSTQASRRRWLLWVAAPVVVFALPVVLLARDNEPLVLDEGARARLPGRFVALSHGYTNYEVLGPERGPVVLLIPGISIPRAVFDRTLGPLAEAGYRVIAFDLYGRGFSDRPRVRYDAALFNRQIDDLLSALRIDGSVNLIGLASGGLQAMLYADKRPSRVSSLVLIAPDGVDAPVPGMVRMMRLPFVGELTGRLVLNAVGQRRWEERLQKYSADSRLVEDIVRQFRTQLQYKGFWRALGSSIASLPISESSDLFRRIERQGTRTLVLWGASDVIIPVQLGQEVRRLMPSATYIEIPAGHLPQYERPYLTNAAILQFLGRR